MSWRGLLDGVMGRADAGQQKSGKKSDVLTPKSRVKLGDLSVSPMGEREQRGSCVSHQSAQEPTSTICF